MEYSPITWWCMGFVYMYNGFVLLVCTAGKAWPTPARQPSVSAGAIVRRVAVSALICTISGLIYETAGLDSRRRHSSEHKYQLVIPAGSSGHPQSTMSNQAPALSMVQATPMCRSHTVADALPAWNGSAHRQTHTLQKGCRPVSSFSSAPTSYLQQTALASLTT